MPIPVALGAAGGAGASAAGGAAAGAAGGAAASSFWPQLASFGGSLFGGQGGGFGGFLPGSSSGGQSKTTNTVSQSNNTSLSFNPVIGVSSPGDLSSGGYASGSPSSSASSSTPDWWPSNSAYGSGYTPWSAENSAEVADTGGPGLLSGLFSNPILLAGLVAGGAWIVTQGGK